MTLVNIISALGNNNSIYPLLVRDCGIENVAKVAMTYNQNAKDSKFIARQATRERIIDEYGTSAVWLGGIPLMSKISDAFIKRSGLSPEVDIKLFNAKGEQSIAKNIEKFKNLAVKEVNELVNVGGQKRLYQIAQTKKFLATTIIPIAVMGFVLPKLNFKYTEKKIEQAKNPQKRAKLNKINKAQSPKSQRDAKKVSFSGLESLASLSTLQKMMILDGGLTVGRVQTGRNRDEKAEIAFKMAGMCYLNYVAPKSIDKGLNALTKGLFGINTALDPAFLNNKNFVEAIKNNDLNLPKDLSEKALLDFVDANPKSLFVTFAQKSGLVSILENGIRDPRKYVDIEKLAEFKASLQEFAQDALKSGNVESFAKKALCAKSFNIVTNVLLSSALLALALPKAQFIFRKILTGKNTEPGIKL